MKQMTQNRIDSLRVIHVCIYVCFAYMYICIDVYIYELIYVYVSVWTALKE